MADDRVYINDFNKENVYNLFVKYYDNPNMIKIQQTQQHCIYAVKIHCLLSAEHRYLFVVVNEDNKPINNVEQLQNLYWVSFQAKKFNKDLSIPFPPHKYVLKRNIATQVINRYENTKVYSKYNVENLPILVTLLVDNKEQNNDYQASGTLILALETFNTVITFK